MSQIIDRNYAHPDVLVTTDWVAEHLHDPSIRLVESNEDTLLYAAGHIPGAVHVDWTSDLNDQIRRDYVGRDAFNALMSRIGVTRDTTVVFYGDRNNWWACYAFWVFQLFGHARAKVMDGGRLKWEKENRPLTRDIPRYAGTTYNAPERQEAAVRAFREEVLAHVQAHGQLVDVRSPEEFSGTRLHMPDTRTRARCAVATSRARRASRGRVPSTRRTGRSRAPTNCARCTWSRTGSLRQRDDCLCRIGERSSHTWFALKYLLGFENVRNYDGSWTEWGNLVGVPIEK